MKSPLLSSASDPRQSPRETEITDTAEVASTSSRPRSADDAEDTSGRAARTTRRLPAAAAAARRGGGGREHQIGEAAKGLAFMLLAGRVDPRVVLKTLARNGVFEFGAAVGPSSAR